MRTSNPSDPIVLAICIRVQANPKRAIDQRQIIDYTCYDADDCADDSMISA